MSESKILEALSSEALSSGALADATGLSKATVLRHLKPLISSNRVEVSGTGRATVYSLPSVLGGPLFTQESKALLTSLQQPETTRSPVGYKAAFLLGYSDTNPFLDRKTREHLRVVGQRGTPGQPAGTYARKILDRLLIDLSWNSSRLEGNTYSLLETEQLIAQMQNPEGRNPQETQMILNHKQAIEFLVAEESELEVSSYTIRSLHALLSENLLDPVAGGALRTTTVRIGESVFYPLDDPHQIGEFFERLVAIARGITDPFEQSFFLLVQIPYLQPFLDVNKRVSRLAANIPFIRGNISPLSFIDVEQKTYILGMLSVYERNNVSILRDMYVWAYERSAARYAAILESIGEPDVFRLEMRLRIKDVVSQVISANLGRSEAADFLAKYSTEISPDKRAEFVAVCMDELNSLHSGNFARYKVRPTQFEAWQKIWLAS